MMRQIIDAVLITSACLSLASCNTSSSSPFAFIPGPAPTVYVGTLADSTAGNGTLTVSLASAAGLTSGTWSMSFGGKADPVYFVSGTVSGNSYKAVVTTCFDTGVTSGCSSRCAFSFTGSLTSSSLSGTYAATSDQSCLGRTGSINANKQ